jgi:DNA-binding IclR family transcriptional regulator
MRARNPRSEAPSAAGTQAIGRAVVILKAIAQGGAGGVGLAGIVERTGLTRSTAHRMIQRLLAERLVDQEADSHRYVIGDLTYELGLPASVRAHRIAKWRPVLEAIARRTGATSYLMGRSGLEAVCLQKAEGASVIRAIPVEIGQRRLLGVGGGSLAILAALDPETCETVIDTIAPELQTTRISPDRLRQLVARTRKTGFAISRANVADEVFGMGMALREADLPPSLAISIAVHESKATDGNIAAWKAIFREEIGNFARNG